MVGGLARTTVEHPVVDRRVDLVEKGSLGFVLGLDIGKSQDPTALALDEIVECERQVWERTAHEAQMGLRKATPVKRHRIVNLFRYPLGTPYPDVYRSVQSVLNQLPARRRTPDLVVDRTGVGAPVVDSMREMGLRPIAVGITAGNMVNEEGPYGFTVPKSILASTLDIALADDRLAITAAAAASDALKAELQGFHAKVSKAGTTSYEAWREGVHDDLVLAVALAVWRGDNLPIAGRYVPFSLHGR